MNNYFFARHFSEFKIKRDEEDMLYIIDQIN